MSDLLQKAALVIALGGGVLAIGVAVVACASADAEVPPKDDDAGQTIAPVDAGEADATPDGDASVAPSSCSPGGWCHTQLPGDATLTGVWGDGTGVVWAISKEGQVLRWDGNAWKVHATDLGPLRAIWGSSPVDIWVSSDTGLVHGTGASSASVAFAEVDVPGDPSAVITSIWGTGPSDVWAVGGRADLAPYAPRVLHLGGGDAGSTWTLEDVTSEPIALSHVWGSAASGVWMAGVFFSDEEFWDEGIILHRAANEDTFTPVAMPRNPDDSRERLGRTGGVSAVDDSVIMVVGKTTYEATGTWRATSSDNGSTFTWTLQREKGLGYTMTGLLALGENDAWSAGEYGRLRHWDGTEWTQSAVSLTKLPLTRDFHAMWGQPAKDLWVVGDGLAVRRDLSK